MSVSVFWSNSRPMHRSPLCGVIAGLALGSSAVFLSASASHGAEPAGTGDKMPKAVVRTLKHHDLDPSQVEAWSIPTFPLMLIFTREVPDAGPFFEGALASGHWIKREAQSGRDGGAWSELSQAALRSRNWARVNTAARLSIARDWVIHGQPPGGSARISGPDGHPITVSVSGSDILLSAWIDNTHETRAGPRTYLASGPTTYRFHVNGSIDVTAPD